MVDTEFPINEEDGDLETLMIGESWTYEKMQEILPTDIVQHAREELSICSTTSPWDIPWWIPTTNG